ncbi:MAG: class I SAM-dependent methyltransferase [Deltaproteobacteria bacterium]|nr:class I SAM-dependent methyltransferase [Deltaproteobacteria bacterium]
MFKKNRLHLPNLVSVFLTHLKQKSLYSFLNRTQTDPLKKLSWSSRKSQAIRFRTFTLIGDLDNKSVLDIGCGLGDFFHYLVTQGLDINYTGYDIVPDFIKTCAQHYPQAHFVNKNILLTKNNEKFDYVFSSGIFALGNLTFFKEMVRASFNLCTQAYAFNIHQTNQDGFFNIAPATAHAYCKKLSPSRISLHNNYLPHDYSVFMYK